MNEAIIHCTRRLSYHCENGNTQTILKKRNFPMFFVCAQNKLNNTEANLPEFLSLLFDVIINVCTCCVAIVMDII